MNQVFTLIGAIVTVVLSTVFFGLLLSLPVMLLWNYCLVGAIAGASQIGWFQAWGIMILCGFLFKPSSSS
jgi:hypothetical protein